MKQLYLLLSFFVFSIALGQNQTIFKDPLFQNPKLAHVDGTNENSLTSGYNVHDVKKQDDGKLLVFGTFQMYRGRYSRQLVRLNEDGTFDDTFSLRGLDDFLSLKDIFPLSNGKILILVNGSHFDYIHRLNNDGSIDVTFNTVSIDYDLLQQNYMYKIKVQADGKIVVAFLRGLSYVVNDGERLSRIIRLNEDGTLDFAFNNSLEIIDRPSNFLTTVIKDIEVLADQKIVVVGDLHYPNGVIKKVTVLNPDGTEYDGFNTEVEFQGSPGKVVATNDNKIILRTDATHNNVTIKKIVRLNIVDGSLDTSFNMGEGFTTNVFDSDIDDFKVQPFDNKIVLSSMLFTSFQGNPVKKVFRLNTDGSLDTSFDLQPQPSLDFQYGTPIRICLGDNGEIFLTGSYGSFNTDSRINGLVKVNSTGNQVNSFSIGEGFTNVGVVNKVVELNNGKILIGGFFSYVNGVQRHGIALLNNDGTLDTGFGTGFGFDNKATVENLIVLPDEKILVGGTFRRYDNVDKKYLIRLNSDGTIDQDFNAGGSGFSSSANGEAITEGIYSLEFQSDGKIIAGGLFNGYNLTGCSNLVRINADGSYDSTFPVGNGFDKSVACLKLQPDGKILVSGYFTKYKNVTNNGFVQLNADATKNATFNSTLFASNSLKKRFCMFPDGSFLAIKKGNGQNSLAKFNPNGTVNPAFNFYSDLSSMLSVSDLLIQQDNKLIVSGYNYGYPKCIYRLNEDGFLDGAFNTGKDFDLKTTNKVAHEVMINGSTVVNSTFMQSNGMILAGGKFSHYAGEEIIGLVRLINIPSYNLKGSNRFDQASDGCAAVDPVFKNMNFNVRSTNNDQLNYFSNNSGKYNIGLLPGNYTVTPFFENPSYFNVSPTSVMVSMPGQISPVVQDFCITPNGNHSDLEVVLMPLEPARPGFNAKYKLVYKNKGNQVQSGAVSLNFDDAVLDYVSAAPMASTSGTNLRTWNFINLNPYETKEIVITLNLNAPTETPPLSGGEILNYTTTITAAQTDETPNDNTFVLNQTVVNSYDPNDKTCLQGTMVGTEKIGDYVHYVIRFENTGTFSAQSIIIKDLIDTAKFDINTLVPLSGSALFTTEITEGNKVSFKFTNINLPFTPGTNTGYVVFKIKTKTTLTAGDTFGGNASIYFDYNFPVITDTYTTTIQALNNPDFTFGSYFTLYPNPVNDILNINKKDSIEISSIHVYNVLGQLLVVIPNAGNTSKIDVSNLPSGNYFLKIKSDKGMSSTKFIKQ